MQAPIAIGVYIGQEHVIEFANPMMCQLWGRRLEQVLNKPLFKALPEVGSQGFEEVLAQVLRTGEPFTGQDLPATLTRNGKLELCYFTILYQPLLDEKGRIRGIIQTATEVTQQVKARKEAEQQEEILKIALESGKLGTWYLDFVQSTFSRSSEYDRIFGYQENLPLFDFDVFLEHVLPEDRKYARASHEQGLKKGSLHYEVRIRRVDGQERWVQIKGETSFNLKGQPMTMSGIIMDITEQKQIVLRERQLAVERAARSESERQGKMLKNLLMQAPALICTLRGPELTFDLVNPQYQQLFRGRRLEGKPLTEALPEVKDQPIYTILRNVYETGEPFSGSEIPMDLDHSGSGHLETSYFNFVYQPMREADGSVEGIVVFAYDVTEQLLARQQTEHSENNLRMALEAGKMGTWHLDLQSGQVTHSLQHDHIFGYSKAVARWNYQTLLDHLLEEDRQMVKDQFAMARKYGDLRFEARIKGADEKLRWILVMGHTYQEGEQPSRMAGVIMDISERKAVEEKLKELTEELASNNEELQLANREIQTHVQELSQTNHQLQLINADLDNFIYTASHDLKAPISNIEGLMHLLIRHLPDKDLKEEMVKKTLDLISASIERFKLTIRDLTDIAKLQKEAVETSLINFSEVLEEVKMDLQSKIDEADAQLDIDIEECQYLIFSHKNLHSILYNLLSNAIKYRSPERRPLVRIRCTKKGGQIVLQVQDNGLGMKEKDLNKIFSMFTRLHTHVEGSGVGLYLVKRILDNAGGKLEVSSELGQGTTFTVYFPPQNQVHS
ncbi:PAS domain-containing sensor histidine kinase [Cesiribacter andamanensis]|uniref:histidine kinase n=1 Tax=Cesiribacter andamanensis AMV16 TaxID=1279009 RepID=M7N9E5_9BACT|nr:PAS domain-containing sensor histidine kinase [Cesiribacter andamanensis]EMR03882.1 Phytochrome-like protein cph1 [Cesiribacter andamanensis AMV16]